MSVKARQGMIGGWIFADLLFVLHTFGATALFVHLVTEYPVAGLQAVAGIAIVILEIAIGQLWFIGKSLTSFARKVQ